MRCRPGAGRRSGTGRAATPRRRHGTGWHVQIRRPLTSQPPTAVPRRSTAADGRRGHRPSRGEQGGRPGAHDVVLGADYLSGRTEPGRWAGGQAEIEPPLGGSATLPALCLLAVALCHARLSTRPSCHEPCHAISKCHHLPACPPAPDSAPGGIRTHTKRILSPLPLPVGLRGRPLKDIDDAGRQHGHRRPDPRTTSPRSGRSRAGQLWPRRHRSRS
jgi:hypothetical protein